MRPTHDPLPADGALIQKTTQKPEGALDESLLGDVLARKPRGISQATFGITPATRESISPKSPGEIVQWFEEFFAAFAPVQS